MSILEDETQITYFVGNTEEFYDTFEEAERVVKENVAKLDETHDKLVHVKRMEIEGATQRPLSGRLTHEEMTSLKNDTYLCFSVYDTGTSTICRTQAEVDEIVAKNKVILVDGHGYVNVETMKVHVEEILVDGKFETNLYNTLEYEKVKVV